MPAANSSASASSSNYGREAQLTFAIFPLAYIAIMLLCLRQRHTSDPGRASTVSRAATSY
jgi:hypothetical protein